MFKLLAIDNRLMIKQIHPKGLVKAFLHMAP